MLTEEPGQETHNENTIAIDRRNAMRDGEHGIRAK
jgi:hypothetical protein